MKSHDEIVKIARDVLGLADEDDGELISFEGRGSDRSYHRFVWNKGASVMIGSYDPCRVENTYYADIALTLARNGISVPRILHHDRMACLVFMQDLGDVDLWSLRNESWNVRRKMYEKTLRLVRKLHACSDEAFLSGRTALMDAFGPGLYRWERDYFRENFVTGLCRLPLEPPFAEALEEELQGLAERLASQNPTLVHRDLQSQNVMIHDGEPFLIDFQGMRFGNCLYDLGSLLCDPYVRFSAEERHQLLSFYYGLTSSEPDWNEFLKAFWEASAQRLMQALGAYGFLGIRKGLKSYLAHVPSGLRNLCVAAENAGSLPLLLEISVQCERTISAGVSSSTRVL